MIERTRQVLERQRRDGLREAGQHGRLAALDIDLDERGHAEPHDEQVERCRLDLDLAIPLDAGEIGISGTGPSPPLGQRRDRGRAIADREYRAPRCPSDRRFDNRDVGRAAEERTQQTREIRLRLDSHNTAAERRETFRAIPGVCADIEHEIAPRDEAGIEAPHASLAQRDRVVDRQRSRKAESTVEATHEMIPGYVDS